MKKAKDFLESLKKEKLLVNNFYVKDIPMYSYRLPSIPAPIKLRRKV